MQQKKLVYLVLYLVPFFSYSQTYTLEGTVTSENSKALKGAHLFINNSGFYTEGNGAFVINDLPSGNHSVLISMLGYEKLDTIIKIPANESINFKLKSSINALGEVLLKSRAIARSTQNKIQVNENYVKKEFDGSLAKSLEKLPGFNAMEIGSGASKPIIRGLGLNRVVVSENGIKQEGQQWGADHGLEMDALNVESLEILKGVGAIAYGSDAIGGVVKINNANAPVSRGFSGSVYSFGKTVNEGFGSAVNLQYRGKKWFYKTKFSGISYADYNIPTNTISYLNFNIPIYDEKLKNSAGKEVDWYAQAGYVGLNFQSTFSVSNVYQKSGFFPGSHGIPDVSRVLPDGDRRNVEYPFQRVNHFKAISNSTFYLPNHASLEVDLSFQKNHRHEWSLFHTHYAGQEPPEENPNLELDFELSTYDIQARYKQSFWEDHDTQMGIQAKWQENNITGFNFLLPAYKKQNYAFYATHEFSSGQSVYSMGLRYDYGKMTSTPFYDETLYDYLLNNGQDESQANAYALRAAAIDRAFNNFNIMAGFLHDFSKTWELKLNAGTSFRLPTAIELGANGIHHGSFRHEQGDANLDPEKGFVADFKLTYNNEIQVSFNPYAYYFSNYIFLNPSGQFSVLPHSGQLYKYTQSEALLSGLELSITKVFFNRWRNLLVGEYLYNQQLTGNQSRNYPLPFTPANNLFIESGYGLFLKNKNFKNTEFFVNSRLVMQQDRIAQGEEITPGYALFGMGINSELHLGHFKSTINLKISNLLNKKYFNHTSFYRRLEIPEMGRNIQLSIKIPFTSS